VVYGKTSEATRRKVADLKARGGGALQPVNPIRITEYATTWLAKNERRLAPKTYQHYCWAWDKAAPIIGQTRLDRFGRSDVIAMLAALGDAGSSANTIRAVKTVMGIVIADAIATVSTRRGTQSSVLASKSREISSVKKFVLLVALQSRRVTVAAGLRRPLGDARICRLIDFADARAPQ